MCALLRGEDGAAQSGARTVFPLAADRIFRGHRQRTGDSVAGSGFAGAAELSGGRTERDATRSLDDFADAAVDRCGNASSGIRLGTGGGGGEGPLEGEDDRHRWYDVRGQRGEPEGPGEAVGDKGYDSNDTLTALADGEVRSYISEPDRGQRNWKDKAEAQAAVYGNRRRIRGEHGKELLRRRGELLERSFAHAYETGGMRRVHLRGRENILKRVLIHLGGFNLALVMRQLLGKGTPRGLQGLSADALAILLRFWIAILVRAEPECASVPMPLSSHAVRIIIFISPAAV